MIRHLRTVTPFGPRRAKQKGDPVLVQVPGTLDDFRRQTNVPRNGPGAASSPVVPGLPAAPGGWSASKGRTISAAVPSKRPRRGPSEGFGPTAGPLHPSTPWPGRDGAVLGNDHY